MPSGSYVTGTTGYTYDPNGNLATKTSPLPNQTGSSTVIATYQYDALNRLTQKSYSDGLTPTTTFAYDTTSSHYNNRMGRLVTSSVPGWTFSLGYDSMGRLQDKDLYMTVPAGINYLDYTYDLAGNITAESAGYGSATYTYNTAARLLTVTSNYSDPNNPGHVFSTTGTGSDTHYNALGQLTTNTLGDNEIEIYTYDHRGRPLTYAAKLNSSPIYSYSITSYAPNGDILAANDSANGNWTYSYDAFNRLVGSNKNTGQSVFSYVYDRFGNRWQQNGTNSMQLAFTGNSPANPQNNNRMDGYSYDAAGNLKNDGTHNYFYDAENRLLQVDGTLGTCASPTTACYAYDPDGNRVQKISNAGGSYGDPVGTYQFLYDQSGHMIQRFDGTFYQGNIFAGGRHVATVGAGTFFSHADWLGTERVRNQDQNPTLLELCLSLPFGDGLSCSGGGDFSPLHFTGKEHDFESGLDYFGARFDASSFGRFMTPDWSAKPQGVPYAVLDDPQSLNLYTYVGNNPVNRLDRDGHCIDGASTWVCVAVAAGVIAGGAYLWHTLKNFDQENQKIYDQGAETTNRCLQGDSCSDAEIKAEHTARTENVANLGVEAIKDIPGDFPVTPKDIAIDAAKGKAIDLMADSSKKKDAPGGPAQQSQQGQQGSSQQQKQEPSAWQGVKSLVNPPPPPPPPPPPKPPACVPNSAQQCT